MQRIPFINRPPRKKSVIVAKRSTRRHQRRLTTKRLLGWEFLETRRLLATLVWNAAAGGDWGLASNWSPAQVPSASDDAIIPSLSGSQVITIANASRAARTIQVGGDETLRITGGTLNVSSAAAVLAGTGSIEVAGGTLSLAGNGWTNTSSIALTSGTLNLGGTFTQPGLGSVVRSGGTVNLTGIVDGNVTLNANTGSWQLSGGTIRNGSVNVDATVNLLVTGNSTFNNVIVPSGIDVTVHSTLIIVNGLLLEGRILLGSTSAGGKLLSTLGQVGTDTQEITGSGQIVFNNRENVIESTSGTLILGSGISLPGRNLLMSGSGTIELRGNLSSDGNSAAAIAITPRNFINAGVITSATGSIRIYPNTYLNAPSGQIVMHGGDLRLGDGATSRTWDNQGLIQTTNTSVFLGGTFTQANIGDWDRSAIQPGTVTLNGTLDGNLNLDASTGPWQVSGGTLRNATITTAPEVSLLVTGNSTFNDVVVPSGVDVNVHSNLTIVNGLTLDGRIVLGSTSTGGRLASTFSQAGTNTQEINGSGQILFNDRANSIESTFNGAATSGTLILGSGISLTGRNLLMSGVGTIELRGQLSSDGNSAAAIAIAPRNFINAGVITSATGSIRIYPNTYLNAPSGQIVMHEGDLRLGDGATSRTWDNQGLIQTTNTSVFLGGTFTQANIGDWERGATQPGTVTLNGTLEGNLNLDASTGPWQVSGGTLRNATITTAPEVSLLVTGNSTFNDVVVPSGVDVNVHSNLTIVNGLTLDGRIVLGSTSTGGRLASTFSQAGTNTQEINGSGQILFNDRANSIESTFNAAATSGTLILGSGISLTGRNLLMSGVGTIELRGQLSSDGNSAAAIAITPGSFVNTGVISSSLGTVRIYPNNFVNTASGQVVINGGELRLGDGATSRTWDNQGLIQITNSSTYLGGTFSQANIGNIQRNVSLPGIVTLNGTVDGNLSLDATTGPWLMSGGTLRNGTVTVDSAVSLLVSGNSTFNNVTVPTDVVIFVQSTLSIINGMTLHGQLSLGNNSNGGTLRSALSQSGANTQAISGSGQVLFNDKPNIIESRYDSPATSGKLIIDSGISLVGSRMTITGSGAIELRGELVAAGPSGDPVNVEVSGFSNLGTIEVRDGGLLTLRTNGLTNLTNLRNVDTNLISATVDGGRFIVDDGTLRFHNSSPSIRYQFTELESDWTISGPSSSIQNGSGSTVNPLLSLREIGASGRLTLQDHASLFPTGEVVLRGELSVDATSTFGLPGVTSVRQVDGIVTVDGSMQSSTAYLLEGGTLKGIGVLPTALTQTGGTLAPGNSPGCITINGDYQLASEASLQIEVEGATVCSQFDQVTVNGQVSLAGSLNLLLSPSYTPAVGEDYLILENDGSDAIVGEFEGLPERQVFSVNSNQLFQISYIGGTGNDVVLTYLGRGAIVSSTSAIGSGSLFEAIVSANASPGLDLIAFSIPVSDLIGETYAIAMNSSLLPAITDAVIIDATTQREYVDRPIVELRGTGVGAGTGLDLQAGNSLVRSLSITGWDRGININAPDVSVERNYVGLLPDGSIPDNNTAFQNVIGINIQTAGGGATIGHATLDSERNVVSGQSSWGIVVDRSSNNFISRNYVGTDPTGQLARGNKDGGISVSFLSGGTASNNIISKNVISGNTGGIASFSQVPGIRIYSNGIGGGTATANKIEGNFLGTNADGTAPLGNGIGVYLGSLAHGNSIGGLTAEQRNVISGNQLLGVSITESNSTLIQGNYIGLDVAGSNPLGNGNGVQVSRSTNTQIGGTLLGAGNVISANASYGLFVNSLGGNVVAGNIFGMNAAGDQAFYSFSAITLQNTANNIIGLPGELGRNWIAATPGSSGQSALGIAIYTDSFWGPTISQGNVVQNNTIGLNKAGDSALGELRAAVEIRDAQNNQIGVVGSGNYIAGSGNGIEIFGYSSDVDTSNNQIQANVIGLNVTGTMLVPNQRGIYLQFGAKQTLVGGTAPGEGNVISGNETGILVGYNAVESQIESNWIGTNIEGGYTPGLASGNRQIGIWHQGGIRSRIVSNSIVANGLSGPMPADAPGAIDMVFGDAVLSQNRIFNNFLPSIRTDVFPGIISITQSRLDGFAVGEVVGATPFTTMTVEFFEANEQQQAERFVGTGYVVTDEDGYAEFEISDLGDLTPGMYLTATITGSSTEGSVDFNTSSIGNGAVPQVALIRGLPTRSAEGKPISLQAFAVDSTISGYAITGYVWEVFAGGQLYASGNEAGIQFSPDDEGLYTVSLTLTLIDTVGNQQTVVLGPHDIHVFNVAPTAQFEIDPMQAVVGQSVTMRSSSTDPGRDDVLLHMWEIRYGSPYGDLVYSAGPAASWTSPTFTAPYGGNFYVKLSVDDADGGPTGARSLTRLLQVQGLPSSTSILVPATGSEGQSIRARAAETELQRADELSFAWEVLKDGVPYPFTSPAAGVIDFTPDDNATYTVTLSISDGTTSIAAEPQTIEVTNSSPIVSVEGFNGIAELGEPLNFTATVFDPGTADTHEVNWIVERQGFVVETSSSDTTPWPLSFTPTQAGVYKIIATATDDDFFATGTGQAMGQKVIYVADSSQGLVIQRPTEPVGGFIEGESYAFTAMLPDLPAGVTVSSYQWSALDQFGRSSQASSGSGPAVDAYLLTPDSGGDFLAVVEVLFSDGRSAKAVSDPIAVQGLAPQIASIDLLSHLSNQQVYEGDGVRVGSSAIDSGERVGLTYLWELRRPNEDWLVVEGLASLPSEMQFTPFDDGIHRVRLTVSDSEGWSTTDEFTRFGNLGIDVVNALPSVQLSVMSSGNSEITFAADSQDPGLNDQAILGYSWSVNGGGFTSVGSFPTFTTSLASLNSIAVRVYDDDSFVELRSWMLLGTNSNDTRVITISDADAAVAVGGQQIVFLGLDGDDVVVVAAGLSLPVVLFGGEGSDTLDASAATYSVILDGGNGDDTLRGGASHDRLIAGVGTNRLEGGDGNNVFIGGGSDTLIGGSDNDYYYVHFSEVVIEDTSGGQNTVDLSQASQGVSLDFGSTTGIPQNVFPGSTLALNGDFQTLAGSPFDDDLSTNRSGTTLIGGGGNNRLVANAIDVTLDGGSGNSELILSNASGSFKAGEGLSSIVGTLAAGSSSSLELQAGGGVIDVVGAAPNEGSALAEVTISGGAGEGTITAQQIRGKIYAYQGAAAGPISEFGSTSHSSLRTISVGNSTDVDIFGSARPGNTIVVTQSREIDIFGSSGDSVQLTQVEGATLASSLFGSGTTGSGFSTSITGSSNIDIFGSTRSQSSLGSTINNSTDIDIFGSARSQTHVTVSGGQDIDIFGISEGGINLEPDGLGNPLERVTIRISEFGSTNAAPSLPITVHGSQDIDIFGSTSTTGTPIQAVIQGSSDIDIFGSAARQTSIIATGSSDIGIFGVLDGDIRLGPEEGNSSEDAVVQAVIEAAGFGAQNTGTLLSLTIHNSSEIDIFGGISTNSAMMNATVSGSTDIDIFGSVRGGLIQVNSSQDIDIFGQGSDSINLDQTQRAAIFTQVFGSSTSYQPLQVAIGNQSTDIDIFGSSNRNMRAVVTNSTDIDIFGGAAEVEIEGVTFVGDEVMLSGISGARVAAGSFGSTTLSQSLLNLTVGGNSSDIDIFGSSLGASQISLSESHDIDIFGGFGDLYSLTDVVNVRIEGGVFGSVSAGTAGLTATVVGNSQDIDIFGTSTLDVVDIQGGMNYRLALRSGDDILNLSDAQQVIGVFDGGDDAVNVHSGSDMLLYLADGNDRLAIYGGDNIRVIGGDDTDQILVSGGSQLDFDGGRGDDLVVVADAQSLIVRLDEGENELRQFGGRGVLAVAGAGQDRMTVYGRLGNTLASGQVYALLDGGDGDDQLSFLPLFTVDDPQRDATIEPFAALPSWMELPSHISSPAATSYPSSLAMVGGAGNDTLKVFGNQQLLAFGGDGNDHLDLLGGSTSTISGGDGADILKVHSNGLNNYVFGGNDDDLVTVYSGTKVGVFTEAGNDSVTFSVLASTSAESASDLGSQQSFARGGLGNDTFTIQGGAQLLVAGEVGQNTIDVEGGLQIVAAGGVGPDTLRAYGGDNVVLLGESGRDRLEYHDGNRVILSGGDGDDRLQAMRGGVQLYGDDGDDWYTLGNFVASGEVLIRELLFLDGQNIEAEARGSDTIDLSAIVAEGPAGATLDLRRLDETQTVVADKLSLTLRGAIENIIGTSGHDWLFGNDEANRLDGGAGSNSLYGFGGDDQLLANDGNGLLVGGAGNDQYLINASTSLLPGEHRIVELENQGVDRIDFSQLSTGLNAFSLASEQPQSIAGGLLTISLFGSLDFNGTVAEIEELTGTNHNDSVVGNALDNRFELLSGDNVVDGASGDDLYVFVGAGLGSLLIQDAASYTGRRTLDFAAFDAPVTLDLELNQPQDLGGELLLTLNDPMAFHNVVGSSYDDRISGNANNNSIYGASGRDILDGRAGNDELHGDLPQVVLLDFDSAFRATRGDYNYSVLQRQQILLLIAERFASFNWRFTLSEDEARAWTQGSGRSFVRMNFSEGRGGGVSGDAGEIDFRNLNRNLVSQVNINSLKASIPPLLQELLEREPSLAEIDDAIVRLTAHIAAHELGHTAGLRHADALGPIGTGFFDQADLSQIYPPYVGPLLANETRFHLIASPASMGTTIADALGETYFGAREAIKLAFNEHGRTIQELNTTFESHAFLDSTAQDLQGLTPLFVPNLAPETGSTYSGVQFDMSAIAVVGNLSASQVGEQTISERDVYRFTGQAGEWLNIEVIANGLSPSRGQPYDGQVKLFKSDGQLLAWNDDEFEGTKDAVLFDVQLPEDGEYFIEVSLSDAPAIDLPGDRYELFISRFQVHSSGSETPTVVGDTLIGGLGADLLFGSDVDDLFLATQAGGVDTIFGRGGFDALDVQGLDYDFEYEQLDSVEQVYNFNIAPQAVLMGVPTSPIPISTAWTATLESPYDPSIADSEAGFRYAFAVLNDQGSLVAGSLPALWSDAGLANQRTFEIAQPGAYTLVARIVDVRNAFHSYEASFIVEGNVNQPPSDIALDNAAIDENRLQGTLVGNLSAIDADEGEAHHYELAVGTGDDDNAAFEIVGSEVRSKASFDFENRNNYSIRVLVRDSAGNTFSKPLTIAIRNAPELVGPIVVGDGTEQRSLVKQLSMLFDTQLQLLSGAFVLHRREFDAAGNLALVNVPLSVTQQATADGLFRVVIRFVHAAGSTTVRQGSLALQDGNYQLAINGDKVRAVLTDIAFDGDGDGRSGGKLLIGDQASHGLYSFFGDIRGLRAVGAFESDALRKTLNKASTHPDFDSRFDADGNGAVAAFDNNEMRKSLKKSSLPWK